MNGNVVWVLGSGFSQPLGGPQLGELFAEDRRARICQRYERKKEEFQQAFAAYGLHDMVRHGSAWAMPWRDGEQFLEVVDIAADPGSPETQRRAVRHALANRIRGGADVGADHAFFQLAEAARLYVAAVCSEFVHGEGLTSMERWDPYLKWARQMNDHDAIITFNYDLVVEKAFAAIDRQVHVARPREEPIVQPMRDRPHLFKLHGSVGWVTRDIHSEPFHEIDGFDDQLQDGFVPAIVGPGTTKKKAADGTLSGLWKAAVDELRRAQAVVFVGYRFPETDAQARRTLLNAIASNSQPGLVVRTVLGPRADEHSERLLRLLSWALNRRPGDGRVLDESAMRQHDNLGSSGLIKDCMLHAERLYSQDFLSVARRDQVGLPRR